ncbi:uncharacterized protein LOC106137001 [Amyelois transitella]|uniref:uncharacterized protein LOC106137001 n=1 Tax=Amyelois transitella TaxID=680683 RepID=UPI00298FC9FC|nr:uncharacterized protein LOC106137001 [Amyelois transitella]
MKIQEVLYIALINIEFLVTTQATPPALARETNEIEDEFECKPLVIAHRGASGYVPEHTLGSYSLAIAMGADYIEPDLVITKDSQLIIRHDNELSLTTDVSQRHEFANRRRNQTVDGTVLNGWFTEDFTLKEIKTLRVVERLPNIRPGNSRMDGSFSILTFQEILDLAKSFQNSAKRVIGVYPEIKRSTYFRNIGLPMEQLVVDTLHRNGYQGAQAPAYIQSFEVNNLKELKKITDIKLLQLFETNKSLQPADQAELGTGLTYGDMASVDGLKQIAKYASAVGPDKAYIIPRTSKNQLGSATRFVEDAHKAGLKVHPYGFRAENYFLPDEFQSKDKRPASLGNFQGELKAYLETGIDGLFSDQPDIPINMRKFCVNKTN